MLGHNGLSGAVPDELSQLSQLQYLMINYNAINGQFPAFMAPKALGFCYATPNQFQTCPDPTITGNPESLAFQCSMDCVVSNVRPSAGSTLGINRALLGTVAVAAMGAVLAY